MLSPLAAGCCLISMRRKQALLFEKRSKNFYQFGVSARVTLTRYGQEFLVLFCKKELLASCSF
jgi:hypothetical protein